MIYELLVVFQCEVLQIYTRTSFYSPRVPQRLLTARNESLLNWTKYAILRYAAASFASLNNQHICIAQNKKMRVCRPLSSSYLGILTLLLAISFVSDIAIFVLKRDVKLQLTNLLSAATFSYYKQRMLCLLKWPRSLLFHPVRVRGPDPQKNLVLVFYGSDLHETFTEINLISTKSTPGAAL